MAKEFLLIIKLKFTKKKKKLEAGWNDNISTYLEINMKVLSK